MNCKKCKKEIPDGSLFCMWCGRKQTSTQRKSIKRENGTGSVYKRSDLKNRPWVAATPAKGTNPPEIIGYYETAQEAKDALEIYRKNPTNKINITLKELYEEWKPIGLDGKSKQLGDSYHAAYKKLSPLYGEKFRNLRTGQFQQIIDFYKNDHPKLDKEGNQVIKDGEPVILPPMSYSSLHDVKVLAGLLYQYAMQNDIINKNYAEFISLPEKPKGVKDSFNDLERKKIEDAVGKIPFADCIMFLNYTGLRIAEFLTLTKFDVHEKDGVCALYGGIKTEAGKNKIVPIHHKIKPILDDWMAKNGETIFCRPDGKPYRSDHFRKKCFAPALEKIGVRALTPHACRRTCATMMSTANVREEDFIAIMGHTDYSVDIESYIFQSAKKLQPSIERLS